jgi:shikimate kinase
MNITLIGMSGVGKSKIGKALSKRLGYGFIDIDKIMERTSGKKLQEMIDGLGCDMFLKAEENAILGIGNVKDCVIAPGGSSVYSHRAMDFLKGISKIAFLKSSLGDIKSRVTNFSSRGIVGLREKGLERIFEERQPLYRKYADITIDLPKKFSKELIVGRIIEKMG